MSEGRNNLDKGGLFSTEATLALSDFEFSLWGGTASNTDYDELNFSSTYRLDIANFESYLAYTRLEFHEDNTSDNELSIGTAYTKYAKFTPAIDYVYSTESSGAFIALSVSTEFTLFNECLTLFPYLVAGFDYGLAFDKHDGLNNIELGLVFTHKITKQLELNGYISHSIAQEDIKQENDIELTWAGIGLAYTFN